MNRHKLIRRTVKNLESGFLPVLILLVLAGASILVAGGALSITKIKSIEGNFISQLHTQKILSEDTTHIDSRDIKNSKVDSKVLGTVLLPDGSFSAYKIINGQIEDGKYAGNVKIEFISGDFGNGTYDTDLINPFYLKDGTKIPAIAVNKAVTGLLSETRDSIPVKVIKGEVRNGVLTGDTVLETYSSGAVIAATVASGGRVTSASVSYGADKANEEETIIATSALASFEDIAFSPTTGTHVLGATTSLYKFQGIARPVFDAKTGRWGGTNSAGGVSGGQSQNVATYLQQVTQASQSNPSQNQSDNTLTSLSNIILPAIVPNFILPNFPVSTVITGIKDIVSSNPKLSVSTANNTATLNLDLTGITGTIADGGVTEAKIAGAAITEGKIASGAITDAKVGTLSSANKVLGSAVQLSTKGGLTNDSGLSLLRTCSDGQLLKWNNTGLDWECANDSSGGGGGAITIQENDTTKVAIADTLDFVGNDFTVTESPTGEGNISIDYANSKIVRSDQAEIIASAWTFSNGLTLGSDTVADITGSGLSLSSGVLNVSGLTTSNFTSANISQFTNNAGYITPGGTETLTNKTIAAGSNTISGLTNSNLTGSAGITNANLANSSINIGSSGILTGGGAVSLGGSLTLTATEADTLASITGRGASTATGLNLSAAAPVTFSGTTPTITFSGGNTTFDLTGAGTRTLSILNSTSAQVADLSVEGQISGSNLSGNNTGDQTITLTGDVTGSGTGSFATTIGANTVALTTDTTGNYVASITNGTGITGGDGGGEGSGLTLGIDTGVVATLTGAQTLTNKTIAAGSNTITGLTNSNLSGTAGITNANLANSSITVGSNGILSGGGTVSLGGTLNLTATEADTLASVTGRGASTATGLTLSGATPLTLSNSAPVVTLGTGDADGSLVIKDSNGSPHTLFTLTDSGTVGNLTVTGTLGGSNFSGSSSGTNTGDQTITLTGDVTGSGTGSFATTIGADKVALTTQTTGNYVQSITNGNGLTGGNGGGEGSALTLALSSLTGDWNQTGAFDVILNNSSSELKILESGNSPSLYGIFDVGDLFSSDSTFTFSGTSGTVLTTANAASSLSGWDQNASDDLTTGNYAGTLDSVYVNTGESPSAGDISGSFSGGLTVAANAVALTTDTTGNYVANVTAGNSAITIGSSAGEGWTPTVSLALQSAADALSSTTSNGSGLEISTGGATLLQGCSDGQILKWNESADTWGCQADATGGGAGNSFETIAVTGGSSPVADSSTDTLTISDGAGITVTGNSGTDTLTIASTLGTSIANSELDDDAVNFDKISDSLVLDAQTDITAGSALSLRIGNNATLTTTGTGSILATDLNCTDCIGSTEISGLTWGEISGTPTTLSGYGITDALSNSSSSVQDGYFGDLYLRDDSTPSHYLQITNVQNLTAGHVLSLSTGNADRTLTISGDANISGTSSGTNTGDQTITLTGDVTGSGTGSFATTIAGDSVALTTDTTGNYVQSITNGSGISGGNGGGEGSALTLALGALSADWNQTGAFDISLNNSSSEIKMLESGGTPTLFGILDVGDLSSSDATYTFSGSSGTVLTTTNYTTTLDSVYVNVGESPTGGDVAGSFSGGLTLNANTVDDSELVDSLTYTGALSVGNLTISDTNIPLTGASLTLDFNNASDRTLTIANSGAGTANLAVDGTLTGSNLSGTNTGDQTITLTGDVTGSGTGSFAATIAANSVALTTDTTGNYVQSANTDVLTGLSGGSSGSEGSALSLAFDYSQALTGDVGLGANAAVFGQSGLIFEGSAANTFETYLSVTNPTADRTITIPDLGGTVVLSGHTFTGDVTATLGSGGTTALTVASDSVALTTDTTGNYVQSITNGSGIGGGNGGGEGSALTLALGALTADWNQTGVFDISLNNTSSELKMLESGSTPTLFGIFDVGDLSSADSTFTFSGSSGTVLTTANYTTTLDSAYVNVGESPSAGDISGSFSGGLNLGNNTVDDAELVDSLTYTGALSVGNLTVSDTNVPLTGASLTLDFNNASDRTLTLANSGAGTANLSVDGTVTGSNLSGSSSGTNTGDQTITLTGDVTGSGTGSFAATIAANAVALTTDTTGNYVANVTAGNNAITIGGSAGEGWTPTVSLSIQSAADALSSTTSNGSGLEVTTGGATLLQGCADGQILKWNETADTWGCSADSSGGGSLAVQEGGSGVVAAASAVNFAGSDFVVTDQGSNVAGIALDYSNLSGTATGLTVGDLSCTNCIGPTEITDLTLTTDTAGNYVASANTSVLTGLIGGSGGSEGAALTLAFDYSQALTGDVGLGADAAVFGTSGMVFEGSTANTIETFISITNPTSSDKTITIPDASGTVILSGHTFTSDVTATLGTAGTTALTIAGDAVALTTDTTGNYVATLTNGLGISGSSSAEGGTPTIAFDVSAALSGDHTLNANEEKFGASGLIFEGSNANTVETYFVVADPTSSDKTITFPDASGTVVLSGHTFTSDVTATLGSGGTTALTIAADSVALGTDTTNNYVASTNTSVLTGLTGGSAGSEGAALTLAFDYSQALSGDVGLNTNAAVFGASGLVFEGSTANTFETFISVTNPTSDQTITIPDASGTVILSGHTFTSDVTATLGAAGTTALTIAADSVALGTDTTNNYVASTNTSVLTGLTGGSGGSEGAALTLAFDYSQALSGDVGLGANAAVFGASGLVFEGSAANTFETFFSVTNPTADRTVTFPDRSGTVALSGDTFTTDVTGTLDVTGVTALTIASNAVALTTDTTGNYVAGATSNGGLTLTGTEAGTLGITLPTATDALSSTTSSGSGMELLSAGLTLLQGCSDGQILKWTESSDTWSCQADNGGAGGGVATIKEGGTSIVTSATAVNFAASDFAITDETGGQAGIAIDYTNSKITRSDQTQTVSGAWTFSTGAVFGAATSVTLGTSSSATGAVVFKNSSNTNTATIQSGATSASYTWTLPTADSAGCLGSNGSGTLSIATCGDIKTQTITTTGAGTYTKPAGAIMVIVEAVGAGGGGGGGGSNTGAVVRTGGSGGGGGAYNTKTYNASDLGSTENYSVGAGGTAGTGGASGAVGVNGGIGGATTFGTTIMLTAGGGGGGRLGAISAVVGGGGGGGGTSSSGATGTTAAGAAGAPSGATTTAVGGQGAPGSISATAGVPAEFGGGGGGGHTAVPANGAGGTSLHGGGGGGVGGGATVTPATVNATAGGNTGTYSTTGGGGGAAGTSGASPTAGTAGAVGNSSTRAGAGGGGGGGTITASTAGATGGAGGAPGGGAGGGGVGSNTGVGGAGGTGGRGELRIWTIKGTGADLAEIYGTLDDTIGPGDVVALDSTLNAGVKKTQKAYDQNVFGVISTAPSLVMGALEDENAKPVMVALSGRVPIKVSMENGPIKAGDLLTPSTTPGVAMKATKAGQIIGQAMIGFEGIAGTDSANFGLILAFIKNSSSNGASLTDFVNGLTPTDGSLVTNTVTENDKTALLHLVSQKDQLAGTSNLSEINTDRIMAALEIITPKLLADEITVRDLITSGLKVTGSSVFLGNVEFTFVPQFNRDSGGFAVIGPDSHEVDVNFDKEYAFIPVVVATPDQPIAYSVTNNSTHGFTIKINDGLTTSVKFNWIALAVKDARTVLGASAQPSGTPVPTAILSATPISSATPIATPVPTVAPSDTPTPTPVATPAGQTLTILSSELGYVRLRDLPSVDGNEIAQIPTGTVLTYTDNQNGWYQVSFNGQTGWVSGTYIQLN